MEQDQTTVIKPGKMGHKTRNGKRLGRPKIPMEQRKLKPKKELVIEKKPRKHKIEKDDVLRRSIMGLAKMGKSLDDIADFVGVSKTWLFKNYGEDIRAGKQIANALVVENLYQQAMKDAPSSIQAGIYITKARMGWKDKDDEGSKQPAVVFDFSGLDYDERINLMNRIKARKENIDIQSPIIEHEGEDNE